MKNTWKKPKESYQRYGNEVTVLNYAEIIKEELQKYIKEEKAAFFPKFFQAFEGGYGEGDLFLGVVVPE